MEPNVKFILAAAILFPSFLGTQYADKLSKEIVGQTVVIRNYYTDSVVNFDANGELQSAGTPGFGPTDGRLYIEKVELRRDALDLIGLHTVPVYQPSTGDFKLITFGLPVKIQIALPSGKPPEESVPALLNRVFVKTSEQKQNQCSQQEEEEMRSYLAHVSGQDKTASEPPSSQQPYEFCLTHGERAYRVGGAVIAPKPLKTPDPHYSPEARSARVQGTVILETIVDTQGRPTTLQVVRPLGLDLDEAAVEAVKKWTFRPATLHGQAVPVLINVEVNFRLY
jgi:TonB family protein